MFYSNVSISRCIHWLFCILYLTFGQYSTPSYNAQVLYTRLLLPSCDVYSSKNQIDNVITESSCKTVIIIMMYRFYNSGVFEITFIDMLIHFEFLLKYWSNQQPTKSLVSMNLLFCHVSYYENKTEVQKCNEHPILTNNVHWCLFIKSACLCLSLSCNHNNFLIHFSCIRSASIHTHVGPVRFKRCS